MRLDEKYLPCGTAVDFLHKYKDYDHLFLECIHFIVELFFGILSFVVMKSSIAAHKNLVHDALEKLKGKSSVN